MDSECANTYLITRTWTATDDCGNANTSQVQTQYLFIDDEAPMFNETVSNVTVQCADDVPAFAVLTATDNCDPSVEVMMTSSVEDLDNCGNQVITVTYNVMDDCYNMAAPVSYTITVEDTMAPELSLDPEDVIVDCSEDAPAALEITATDNCDDNITVVVTEEFIGDQPDPNADADCLTLNPTSNACETSAPWALTFTGGDLNTSLYEFYTMVDGQHLEYGNTIHLTATVVSTANANAGWEIDVWFENGVDYASWMTQTFPTGIKHDCLSGDDAENWMFYIMTAGQATLTGWGDFAGSSLSLTHAPSNNYYGYQVGVGGNNQSEGYGAGGWFSYTGTFIDLSQDMNESVSGAGDISVELDCCPRYFIERTYTATDCSGNSTSVSYTVSFEDLGAPSTPEGDNGLIIAKGDTGSTSVYPNPAIDEAIIEFKMAEAGTATISIYTVQGVYLGQIFNEMIEANTTYKTALNVQDLNNGVYVYKVSNGKSVLTNKVVVSK